MTEYLKAQKEGSDPLEFLKLAQGHDLLKLEVCKQPTLLSEIEVDISVQQSLQIKSDRTVKSRSLADGGNAKNTAIDKIKNANDDK